jgi:hypothetical protein
MSLKKISGFLALHTVSSVALAHRLFSPPADDGVLRAEFFTTLVVGLIMSAVLTVLAELLRPKQEIEDAKPASRGDFNFPTAVENRPEPIIWGRNRLGGPNVVWWGNLRQVAIRTTIRTGLWSKNVVTTGFRYYAGIQMSHCHGGSTTVSLVRIWIGDREVNHNSGTEINEPDFFGGDDLGRGGLIGTLSFYGGSLTQTADAYLTSTLSPNPVSGYRGSCYTVFQDGYLGNSTSIEPWSFELERLPSGLRAAAVNAGVAGSYASGQHIVNSFDTNPMELIYECLVDADWGMARNPNSVNLANFAEVAATCYAEGNGIAFQWERVSEIRDVIKIALQQIDGVLYRNRNTGLFEVRLARQDYTVSVDVSSISGGNTINVASGGLDFDVGSFFWLYGSEVETNNRRLTVASRTATTVVCNETLTNEVSSTAKISVLNGIDASTIVELRDFSRQTWDGTTNQVRVEFSDRSRDYFNTFARADSLGNQRMQRGETVISNIRYPGVKNGTLATAIAAREARTLSFPLAKGTVTVNREFWDVHPGDVVRFTYERLGIADLPVRITRPDFGKIDAKHIILPFVQDIFSLETGFFGVPPATFWSYPTQAVAIIPADEQIVLEAPYAIARRDPGQSEVFIDRLWCAGRQTSPGAITLRMFERHHPTTPAGDYALVGEIYGFVLVGDLRTALSQAGTQGSVTIEVDPDPDAIAELEAAFEASPAPADVGQNLVNLIYIGGEFFAPRTVTDNTTWFSLGSAYRGLLDTTPLAHAANTPVFLAFVGAGLSDVAIPQTDVVDVQLRPRSRTAQLAETSAVTVQIQMSNRARRPYLPAVYLVNASSYADPIDVDDLMSSGTSLDDSGLETTFNRRDYRQLDEVASLLADAASFVGDFPSANSHQVRLTLIENATTLTTGLEGSYKLDEATAASAVDYSGNSRTLTDTGSVAAEASGKVGAAKSWSSASSQHLAAASGSIFHYVDADFTISIWVKLDDLSTSYCLWSKNNNTSNNRQYRVQFNITEGRFKFFGSTDGVNLDVQLVANSSGALSAGVWYHVLTWYDATNDILGMRINDGVADTLSHAGGFFNGNEPFRLGNFVGSPGSIIVNKLNGDLDALHIWNRVLSRTEQSMVYNLGNGIEHDFTPGRTIFQQDWGDFTSKLFSRTEMLEVLGGTLPSVQLQQTLEARHTFDDGVVYEALSSIIHTFDLDVSDLDSLEPLGVLASGVASEVFTAPSTETMQFAIGTALGNDVEIQINGGGWSTLITAASTTGSQAVTAGDLLEFRHGDSTPAPDRTIFFARNASAVNLAYAVFSVA